jgi:uncharacterized membrane protein (DUF485 family)
METKKETRDKCPWGDRAFGAILVWFVSFIALILFQWAIWDIRLFGYISILLGILYLIFAKSPGSYKKWLAEILDIIC